MNLTEKRVKFLRKLLDREDVLMCLSSEFAGGDEDAFKGTFGVSFKEAKESITALMFYLNHKYV